MQGLQLRSLVKETGDLELSLVRVDVPEPGDDEVMIRVEATHTISLAEALDRDVMSKYLQRTTGAKYLIDPRKGL